MKYAVIEHMFFTNGVRLHRNLSKKRAKELADKHNKENDDPYLRYSHGKDEIPI